MKHSNQANPPKDLDSSERRFAEISEMVDNLVNLQKLQASILLHLQKKLSPENTKGSSGK